MWMWRQNFNKCPRRYIMTVSNTSVLPSRAAAQPCICCTISCTGQYTTSYIGRALRMTQIRDMIGWRQLPVSAALINGRHAYRFRLFCPVVSTKQQHHLLKSEPCYITHMHLVRTLKNVLFASPSRSQRETGRQNPSPPSARGEEGVVRDVQ